MAELTPTLALTTSTGVISLAVADRAGRVVSVDVATERRHAEEVTPRLQAALAEAGLVPADLGLLVVDIGPGRFTGLRVGLATVRGLAFALDLPVVALTSLEVLAHGALTDAGADRAVTAVIDARRQEVFQQCFVDGQPEGEARVGRPEELVAEARGVVVGDGLDRYPDLYRDADGQRTGGPLRPVGGRHPSAVDMIAMASGRPPRPGSEVGPLYLREPDAKANIRTRPQGVAS